MAHTRKGFPVLSKETSLAGRRPMTISEVARHLLNTGDLLETLRAHGLLEGNEARKQYRLGPPLAARRGMAD